MAGFQKIYTSENEYLYDLGKTTGYFDEEYYNLAKESGSDYQYLQMMASLKQTGVSNTFDPVLYGKLSGEERFNYLATENFMDKSSEDYVSSSQYFKQREKQIKNEEVFAGLSGFEKTIASIGGWFAGQFVEMGNLWEGLINLTGFAIEGFAETLGAKEFAQQTREWYSEDNTGYLGARAALAEWNSKYTFLDKGGVAQAINDVTAGLVRQAPMLIGTLTAPVTGGISHVVGTGLYYGAMTGNLAEETIQRNPDIDYGALFTYVGGSVGIELITESVSDKIFGPGIISPFRKGIYTPAKSLIKEITKNFVSEGLEEFYAEIFDNILYRVVVDPTAPRTTFSDALYAALIGGLTGAIMSGGTAALTTKKLSVVNGQLIETSTLSKDQKMTAKNLGFSTSYGLNTLLTQSQQALQTVDNVTQLMAKYGTSLSDIQINHNDEYQKAVKKDSEIKTQQAKAILDLTNLMNTLGVEQFQRSAQLLNENVEEARKMVDNYLNHTDQHNKAASAAFSAVFKGQTMTPSVQITNAEQELSKALREIYPDLKVAFGTFGSVDGRPVSSVNLAGGWLFIESGLVEKQGYKTILQQTIRNEISKSVMNEISKLSTEYTNQLVKLITDDDITYTDLTEQQKHSIAQIICFDPINNRRLFLSNNKIHSKLFKYINDQSDYVRKFARKTDANKVRFSDLLKIRNTFINSIAETIANDEDVQTAKEQYNLSDEETKTKIIDKTENTILNDTIAVMRQNLDKNVIARQEAIEDLLQNRVETNKSVPFDWSNLYNEEYYNENWVAQIKQQQQTQDFQEALRAHLIASHKVDFSVIEHSTLVDTIKNNVTIDELNKLAETLFTKEYLDTNPDLQTAVADTLYTMVQTEDTDADSIMVKDNQIKGTGRMGFINIQLFAPSKVAPTKDSSGVTVPYELRNDLRNTVVIDSNGRLLRVYHGTRFDFTDFDTEKIAIGKHMFNGPGFDFSTDKIYSHKYKGEDVLHIKSVYLDIQNPVNKTQRIIPLTTLEQFVNKYFEDNAEVVLNKISNAQNDLDVITTLVAQKFPDPMNDNISVEFMRAIKNELGVDGAIGEDRGVTVYTAYTPEQIYELSDETYAVDKSTGVVGELQNTRITEYDEPRKIAKNIFIRTNLFGQTPTTSKQISNRILQTFEDGAKNISETQFSDSNSKEYSQVSYDMIDTMADTFALVNDNNYEEIRNALKKSDKKYAAQALEIFDLYTIEMVGKFNKEIQQKIENNYQKLQTEAGQRLALQAKRVATRKPISHTISTLARDGFNVTVTDEIVQKYDAKLKDKDAYIKELENRIKDLESQIKKATSDIEKTALSKELKDVADKKGVLESGSNADILDYIVSHASTLEQASKIQEDVLDKLLSTAVIAQEEGKKVGYYVYDQDGKLKPFPQATEKLAKTLKKLKSFRMWSMLSSPVTWVRNWMGNQGMRGLDAMTNFVEGFMTSRAGFDQKQMKFTETRAGKELYDYIAKANGTYIMSLVRGEDVKYETSAEKAAALKRQERKIEYDSASAFKKACLRAQDMTDWGLSTGPLGDEPVVFNSICKNMGNLVANNIDFLLQGIRQEANTLNKRETLNDKSRARLTVLNKALETKNAKDVFNALSKEETERLFDVCKERSFQQYFKNPNALSKWFAKFGTKHPVYAELISWVMPFPKVAANVLSMAYRYSPLSFFKGLSELSVYRQTQKADYKGPVTGFEKAQMIRTFSEASVGTFMLIAGAIFSAMGLIDIDEDDYLGPCLKMGDFKVSLSDLAPSMTTFSTASAVVWAWKNDKSAITQALNVLYDNTLLGNVENLLTYGSFTDIAKNVSISYLSQYIPSILKLINKATTGGVKKDKSGTYLQRLIKTLVSYVPGVSQLVPNKIDPYTGEKVYQAGVENWFLNLLATISPLGIKWEHQSEVQRQASALGAETTGLSGKFKINDKAFVVKDKEKYSKYRAEYIEKQFDDMLSGKVKITVEDENGKRITTTYDKLNDKQKKNVINRLYTEATSMTKLKWWTDQGNKYVVTDRDLYNEYRKMFKNIIYKKTWSKSKFVES